MIKRNFFKKIVKVLPVAILISNQNAFASPEKFQAGFQPVKESKEVPAFVSRVIPKVRVCPQPWKSQLSPNDCELREFSIKTSNFWGTQTYRVKASIRSGYLAENPEKPFLGNVIYYEGLGDSMLNHMPLFSKLTQAGFRVIAFDYMGQGESTGSMNDTRIRQIGVLGDEIWKLHARDLEHYPKKNIIGWSTGGLAAYEQARLKTDVNNIVLIVPGIAPYLIMGEQKILQGEFNQITIASLTTQIYSHRNTSPHIDPIRPRSPLEVMSFARDLIQSSAENRNVALTMNPQVNGLVLLSGSGDNYVDNEETLRILEQTAPWFRTRKYSRALHEIDNEAEPTGSLSREDILLFLLAHSSK